MKPFGELYQEALDECKRLKAALTAAEYEAVRGRQQIAKPEGQQLRDALDLKLTLSKAMGGDKAAQDEVRAMFSEAQAGEHEPADSPQPDPKPTPKAGRKPGK